MKRNEFIALLVIGALVGVIVGLIIRNQRVTAVTDDAAASQETVGPAEQKSP